MLYFAGLLISTPGVIRLTQEVPAVTTTTGGGSTDWISYLLNGGPFAIVLLLIVLDKIGTHAERDRLRTENKELREKNQDLNDVLRQEVVPHLTEHNRLMAETLKVLDDFDRFPPKRSRGS